MLHVVYALAQIYLHCLPTSHHRGQSLAVFESALAWFTCSLGHASHAALAMLHMQPFPGSVLIALCALQVMQAFRRCSNG
jgi:hypothetical protein